MTQGRATTLLEDRRDRPLALMILTSSILVPSAMGLFFDFAPGRAAAHLVVYGALLERFVTLFHDAHHRRIFRPRWNLLNLYLFWCLGPLFGSTPDSYFVHHIGMHHREENLEGDVSSTLRYRRDSRQDFLLYYFRFFFSAPKLYRYFVEKGRDRLARRTLVGEALYFSVTAIAIAWNVRAALVVLVLPLIAMRTLLIIGNWGEHAFLDPDEPENRFKSSTNQIGIDENARAFNVGYHIGHHLQPRLHFQEMPSKFDRELDRYARNDALVFQGMNYVGLWWRLMTRNFEALADAWVPLAGAPTQTREQALRLMSRRLVPIIRTVFVAERTGRVSPRQLQPEESALDGGTG